MPGAFALAAIDSRSKTPVLAAAGGAAGIFRGRESEDATVLSSSPGVTEKVMRRMLGPGWRKDTNLMKMVSWSRRPAKEAMVPGAGRGMGSLKACDEGRG